MHCLLVLKKPSSSTLSHLSLVAYPILQSCANSSGLWHTFRAMYMHSLYIVKSAKARRSHPAVERPVTVCACSVGIIWLFNQSLFLCVRERKKTSMRQIMQLITGVRSLVELHNRSFRENWMKWFTERQSSGSCIICSNVWHPQQRSYSEYNTRLALHLVQLPIKQTRSQQSGVVRK